MKTKKTDEYEDGVLVVDLGSEDIFETLKRLKGNGYEDCGRRVAEELGVDLGKNESLYVKRKEKVQAVEETSKMKIRVIQLDGGEKDIFINEDDFSIVMGNEGEGFQSKEEFIHAKDIIEIGFFEDGFSSQMYDGVCALFFDDESVKFFKVE